MRINPSHELNLPKIFLEVLLVNAHAIYPHNAREIKVSKVEERYMPIDCDFEIAVVDKETSAHIVSLHVR